MLKKIITYVVLGLIGAAGAVVPELIGEKMLREKAKESERDTDAQTEEEDEEEDEEE